MNKKRVVVGMSGGVDSSVTAYLLKEQGYEVIGVMMDIWNEKNKKFNSSVEDAKRVAKEIGISFYLVDFKKSFKERVVNDFVQKYGRGKTPNPCIVCNKHIKFGELLEEAFKLGAYYLATGHYARVFFDQQKNKYIIKKGKNKGKDQTYVFYNLTQKQLKHILMPLGDYENKDEVRKIAKNLNLNTANKKESQEICFIKDNNYSRFIKENADYNIKHGNFIDTEGNVVGKHKGITNYTIGQRKGLGLALGKPVYVVNIDAKNNVVVVGDNEDVFGTELIAEDINFISGDTIKKALKANSKIRYNAKEKPSTIYPIDKNKVRIVFDHPVRAITPGQAVVFYDDDILLGGGTILKKLK